MRARRGDGPLLPCANCRHRASPAKEHQKNTQDGGWRGAMYGRGTGRRRIKRARDGWRGNGGTKKCGGEGDGRMGQEGARRQRTPTTTHPPLGYVFRDSNKRERRNALPSLLVGGPLFLFSPSGLFHPLRLAAGCSLLAPCPIPRHQWADGVAVLQELLICSTPPSRI